MYETGIDTPAWNRYSSLMTIQILRWADLDEATRQTMIKRSEADIDDAVSAVAEIIDDVKIRGDEAIRDLNRRFDAAPRDMPIRVPESHSDDAEKSLSAALKQAIEYSVENVRRFHQDQSPSGINWKEIRPGILAGERTRAIDSAAFYVPRARGSFPSMLYMMAVPAQIAEVPSLAVATPADSKGRVDAACLYTARLCGITNVYAMGGAQAWAALAYGTESVQKVDKCIGPGSKYVAAAKRVLANVMDCGLPAGPSESIILADSSPDPADIARNLLVEAEHGSDSTALLITDSEKLAHDVAGLAEKLAGKLPEPRRTFVRDVFSSYSAVILLDSIQEAAELTNLFATEHLQIRTRDPFSTLSLIRNAGEIILGEHCPFSAANYSVGANAVLPTGGKARTWSGVSVADFKKRSSLIYMSQQGLKDLSPHAVTLAEYEDFPAHRLALTDH